MSFVCLFVCLHVSTQVLVYDFFPFRLALVVVVCLFLEGEELSVLFLLIMHLSLSLGLFGPSAVGSLYG